MKTILRISALAFTFAILIFLSSCGTNNSTTTITGDLVKTERVQGSGSGSINGLHTYSYDNQGRITSDIFLQDLSGTSDTTLYAYPSGMVVRTRLRYNNSDTSLLNGNGLQYRTTLQYGFQYESWGYDNDGYMIADSIIYPTNAGTTILHSRLTRSVAGGNVIADSRGSVYTFTSHLDTRNFGMAYQGKRNKNTYATQNTNGGGSYPSTYTYDASGRVLTENLGDGTHTFTY
jgi:hypothetical protein